MNNFDKQIKLIIFNPQYASKAKLQAAKRSWRIGQKKITLTYTDIAAVVEMV